MTPFEIETILRFHYGSTDSYPKHDDCLIMKETLDDLADKGILKRLPDMKYSPVREAIDCYVAALMEVQLPVKVERWEIPV